MDCNNQNNKKCSLLSSANQVNKTESEVQSDLNTVWGKTKKPIFVDMTQLGVRASRKKKSSMHKFMPLSFLTLNAMYEGMNPFSGT